LKRQDPVIVRTAVEADIGGAAADLEANLPE